jgi:hypothetical protein
MDTSVASHLRDIHHRQYLAPCAIAVCLILFGLGGCTGTAVPAPISAVAQPAPTDTPVPSSSTTVTPTGTLVVESPTPTTTPVVTPTVTPTATPVVTLTFTPTATLPISSPTPVVVMPSDPQFNVIVDALQARPGLDPGFVQPPTNRLATLADIAAKLSTTLPKPTSAADFWVQQAATFTLPNEGALYQAVVVRNAEAVESLLPKSSGWDDQSLVVGGILVYQKTPFDQLKLSPGSYLVVLRRMGSLLTFELYDETVAAPVATGNWQLRLSDEHDGKGFPNPFTYISSAEVCFSFVRLQACLSLSSPRVDPDAAILGKTVANLEAARLLLDNKLVNVKGALAGVETIASTKTCSADLMDNPTRCRPDVLAAGAVPGAVLQPGTKIAEVQAGIAIMEVLSPLAQRAVGVAGTPVDVPTGSYRLDLLTGQDGTMLLQFARADDALTTFYALARLTQTRGALVDPDSLAVIAETLPNADLVLDAVQASVCNASPSNTGCGAIARIFGHPFRHYVTTHR